MGVCWGGELGIQITPWKTKHCLKGAERGLVQPRYCLVLCGRRPGLGRVGRERGREERINTQSPLRDSGFVSFQKGLQSLLLCVCKSGSGMCDLRELICMSVFGDLSDSQGEGFWVSLVLSCRRGLLRLCSGARRRTESLSTHLPWGQAWQQSPRLGLGGCGPPVPLSQGICWFQ